MNNVNIAVIYSHKSEFNDATLSDQTQFINYFYLSKILKPIYLCIKKHIIVQEHTEYIFIYVF